MNADRLARRRLLVAGCRSGAAAALGLPAMVFARGLPGMTDGPFYPPIAYRARSLDWDADLTTVRGRNPDGQPLPRATPATPAISSTAVWPKTTGPTWRCDCRSRRAAPRSPGSPNATSSSAAERAQPASRASFSLRQ